MTTLDLKTPMTDFDDEPIKDINSVKVRTVLRDGKTVDKTVEELEQVAPILTYGKVLYNLLQYQATPSDSKQSASLHRYAVTIKNILNKNKGVWDAKPEDIQAVINLLDLVPMNQGSQTSQGAVIVFIEDAVAKQSKA